MRRLLILVALLALILAVTPAAFACGDKFLVGTTGARYLRHNIEPGKVLVYTERADAADWDSRAATLQKQGHAITITGDSAGLWTTLKQEEIDILLLPIDLARQIKDELAAQSSKLIMLPYVAFATGPDFGRAKKEFGHAVKWPATARKLETAIFKSMAAAVD